VSRTLRREVIGELVGSGALVAVVFASGAVRVQLGAGTLRGAIPGSIALGLGYGLVVWIFGSMSGAQTNPLVSIVASLLGGQPWRRTLARIAAQVAGASVAGVLILQLVPFLAAGDVNYPSASSFAEGVSAFGFMLVALGVALRRNVKVPVALGAFATASFWMTGRATVGNPLLSATVELVSTGRSAAELLSLAAAAAIGAGVAVVAARLLFPSVREAASVLLFVPTSNA
jgi:glycerol uptake facilitator-like aquaporin